MLLSYIVPCYNEEENIFPFYDMVSKCMENTGYDYEIIFINDGSKDKTLQRLKELYYNKNGNIIIVNFSRNFGKEAAIYSGLKHAKGDIITIIDADLQQRAEIALEMTDFLNDNQEFDCVVAYQIERSEKKIMKMLKGLFYKAINVICDINFYENASDFRTFRKEVARAILDMPEYFRFSKGLFSWVGFENYYMPYKAEERNAGESKWSINKLIKYAIEGFISFTTVPLKLATYFGMTMSVIAFIYIMVIVIQSILQGSALPGYPTTIALILLSGGIQLLILGIIGEYIARIYVQGKNRPVYIEKEFFDSNNKE